MESFKGRTVQQGQRVDVYKNLQVGAFSIRCSKTQKILAHAPSVRISNCEFKVSESGRQKVLKHRRKKVHAFIRGTFEAAGEDLPDMDHSVYYDPYKTEYFRLVDTNEPIFHAEEVFCIGKLAYANMPKDMLLV